MFDPQNERYPWPIKANGQPKKLAEMSPKERQAVARYSLGLDMAQEIGPNYLEEFDRAFNSVFRE